MMSDSNTDKKKRRPKFTADELDCLVQQFQLHKETITSKFSNVVSNKKKSEAWCSITTAINSIGNTKRTSEEVKRKWHDWASVCKRKEIDRRKEASRTGGGSMPENSQLSELEIKVIAAIDETAISGLPYGIDTDRIVAATRDDDGDHHAGDSDLRSPDEIEDVQKPSQPSSTKRVPEDPPFEQPASKYNSTEQRSRIMSTPRKSQSDSDSVMEKILAVDTERLELEKQRLSIEVERLGIERKKFAILQVLTERVLSSDKDDTSANLLSWLQTQL